MDQAVKVMAEREGKLPHLHLGRRGVRDRHPEDQGDHRNAAHNISAPDTGFCERGHQPSRQGDTGYRPEAPFLVWGKSIIPSEPVLL